MTLIEAVLLAALAGGSAAADETPRRMLYQEPAPAVQEPPAAPVAPREAQATEYKLLDFDHLEGAARIGFLFFSDDFEADSEVAGGLQFRAPSPLLSRGLFGMASDDIGAFLEITVSGMDRDVDPPLDEPDGTLLFITGGLDWTLLRDETFRVAAQGGLQFGHFGGITDTDDGVALLIGAVGAVQVTNGLWVTLTPQAAFADAGDNIFFLHLGLQVEF